jgi:Excreted virulence factor EspC, type VII ESX diderm
MSQPLSAVAKTLQEAGDVVADIAADIADLDPGARAFGANGPGALGELGRDLHRQCVAALAARAQEALAHRARLREAADLVARAALGYAAADEGQHWRGPEAR